MRQRPLLYVCFKVRLDEGDLSVDDRDGIETGGRIRQLKLDVEESSRGSDRERREQLKGGCGVRAILVTIVRCFIAVRRLRGESKYLKLFIVPDLAMLSQRTPHTGT